ncbi:MAG TPA: hypothetical protein VK013_09070 [Myxococcaceae bacterium]|nr:hypothetical protein [Myxococcaceae bacterium]
MTRIPTSSVNAALDRVGRHLTEAAAADKKLSKPELEGALEQLEGTEKALTDVFSRFVQKRSGKAFGEVSTDDVAQAVAYAKASLVGNYDLDGDGLSADEIEKMSRTGKLAVELATELDAGGNVDPDAPLTTGEAWLALKERVQITSREKITEPVHDLIFAQQLTAAAQVAFEDVKTLPDALATIDAGGFTVTAFTDPTTGREYIGVDYGAGDSTYGAIFEAGDERVLHAIRDNEVYEAAAAEPAPAPWVPGEPMKVGEYWNDLLDRSFVASRETLEDVSGLEGSVFAEQLIAAVQQSSLGPVRTLEEAAAAIDAGGFLITHFSDPETSQQLIGIDYGAGDNTYGAIFETAGERPLFAIHDGELAAPRSNKPITTGMETFGAVLDRVTVLEKRTVGPKDAISDELAQQLLVAGQLALHPRPETLAEAFSRTDERAFVVRDIIDPATGKDYVCIDYGSGGGNTFGAIFEKGSTEIAIAIIDGLMEE